MNVDPITDGRPAETPLRDAAFDVVVCGGGMAGLLLALQLRQELPDASVAVVEPIRRPLPPATHKVGESSVELGSVYMRRLGLRDYLKGEHIVKLALRFFPGGGHLPIDQRDELGPARQPLMISYQMDRGKLETDLRAMVVEAGATLLEGARVVELDLQPGDAAHRVRIERGGETAELTAAWAIDATGRRSLLRRQEKLARPTSHAASAGWFRMTGRLDISAMVDDPDAEWHARPLADERWRSTNHLMGEGYWVWVIPLIDGRTSVGIVAHEPYHAFDAVRTRDRCMAFLEAHEPAFARFLRAHLDGGEQVLDFGCLKRYSRDAQRAISADRWAVVGDAGAFHDPLYSPGADSIALANSYAVEAIAADRAGRDLEARVDELQSQLAASVRGGFDYFRETGGIFGHARVMTAKYYWDNFLYWNYLCQHFAQNIYRLEGEALEAFVPLRERFFALNEKGQMALRCWAAVDEHAPEGRFVSIPRFPSILIESNLAILNEMEPEDTFDYMTLRIEQGEQMLAELVLRILTELGPEKGAAFVERSGLRDWGLSISDRRLEAEGLDGKARRRRLGKIGRDVDDHLYLFPRHPQAADAVWLVRGPVGSAARAS